MSWAQSALFVNLLVMFLCSSSRNHGELGKIGPFLLSRLVDFSELLENAARFIWSWRSS